MRSFAGVLGWPLAHSLSPAIHNAAFRRLGLDWVYLPFAVPPEDLPAAVQGLRALGSVGVNVTMPHKETIVELLDDLSGDAQAVGAVNTVQNVGGRLIGHNTDVDGFLAFASDDAGLQIERSRCLVIGAGGAARAIVYALDRAGASSIAVAARREDQALSVLSVSSRADKTSITWDELPGSSEGFDVVINATPLGMPGHDPLPRLSLTEGQAVVDLIYDPPETPLVEAAKAAGGAGWGGLGMLVHQAAASLRIWTGQEAPTEAMSVAALHALSRR